EWLRTTSVSSRGRALRSRVRRSECCEIACYWRTTACSVLTRSTTAGCCETRVVRDSRRTRVGLVPRSRETGVRAQPHLARGLLPALHGEDTLALASNRGDEPLASGWYVRARELDGRLLVRHYVASGPGNEGCRGGCPG